MPERPPTHAPRATRPADPPAWRREQRRRLVAARQALAPEARAAADAALAAHLEAAFPELAAAELAFYWPLRGEPDLRRAVERWLARCAGAALPVVVQRGAPLAFHRWRPGVAMAEGVWGIPVPDGTEAVTPEVLLVPLVGFDAGGHRLGNGGGYYDRTLAALWPRPLAIGVGYELGRLPSIHPEPHDIPMDAVVTEAGVHWPRRPAAPASRAGTPASPVCYADEAPAYLGFLGPDELAELLQALLRRERAIARLAAGLARGGDESAGFGDLRHAAVRGCAVLLRALAAHGAPPQSGTPPPATGRPGAARRALSGELEALAGALVEGLPRIHDEPLRDRLEALLTAHRRAQARLRGEAGA